MPCLEHFRNLAIVEWIQSHRTHNSWCVLTVGANTHKLRKSDGRNHALCVSSTKYGFRWTTALRSNSIITSQQVLLINIFYSTRPSKMTALTWVKLCSFMLINYSQKYNKSTTLITEINAGQRKQHSRQLALQVILWNNSTQEEQQICTIQTNV